MCLLSIIFVICLIRHSYLRGQGQLQQTAREGQPSVGQMSITKPSCQLLVILILWLVVGGWWYNLQCQLVIFVVGVFFFLLKFYTWTGQSILLCKWIIDINRYLWSVSKIFNQLYPVISKKSSKIEYLQNYPKKIYNFWNQSQPQSQPQPLHPGKTQVPPRHLGRTG